MSRDYSNHYSYEGWFHGISDIEPPEPGKEWLTISEDGEEYAVIVLRVDAFDGRPEDLDKARAERVERASRIVSALNAYNDIG